MLREMQFLKESVNENFYLIGLVQANELDSNVLLPLLLMFFVVGGEDEITIYDMNMEDAA